jgi:hypothetical protein
MEYKNGSSQPWPIFDLSGRPAQSRIYGIDFVTFGRIYE